MAGDGGDLKEVRFVRKTVNETLANSDVLHNDNELTIPIAADEIVRVRIVFCWTASMAGGMVASIDGPAATNLCWKCFISDVGATALNSEVASTYNTTAASILAISGFAEIDALIENSVAGNIVATWCQHTSDAGDTTVARGSFMQMWRVG